MRVELNRLVEVLNRTLVLVSSVEDDTPIDISCRIVRVELD
jgi:hypothetical protein